MSAKAGSDGGPCICRRCSRRHQCRSLRSSPWMRGAPQIGLSRLILRIRLRTSFETGGRPRWPRRTFKVQNKRNPLRRHAMTVAGLRCKEPSAIRPRLHKAKAHKHRSNRFSFGFFTERCSRPRWRRARISSCKCRSSARERQRGGEQCRDHGGQRQLTENAQLPLYQVDLNLREPQVGTRCHRLQLRSLPPGTVLVLPSPNGSTPALSASGVPVFTACLRNAPTVAKQAVAHGSRIAVIPAGEQWRESALRPCLGGPDGRRFWLSFLERRRRRQKWQSRR